MSIREHSHITKFSKIFNNGPLLFTIVSIVAGWISARMGDKPIQPDTINTMLNLITDRYFYRPQTKFAKVMFLHVCVCPHGGGSTWAGTPRTRYTPPPSRYTTPRPGKPPWAGTPAAGPGTPSGRYTPRAGTPSRSSACWEIRATSGRYASYWNVFLLIIIWSWITSCVNKA